VSGDITSKFMTPALDNDDECSASLPGSFTAGESQDGSVGIVTDWMADVRFPSDARVVSALYSVQPSCGTNPVSYPIGTKGLFFLAGKTVGA
jgi:hypothetical protein